MGFKNDIFEPDISFTIEEAKGEVDGKYILGKLKGTFFVPDGESRNNRYYKREVWEKQLADENIQKKIRERRMFGTISHEQPLDDKALLEGKISHITTKLSITDDSQGYGEALILDTPAGNILNTVLRAKCKLFTSSRATGAYKGEHNGKPCVDPDNYHLEGFDFVIEPGFLQANPQIVESLQNIDKKLLIEQKESDMDKELFETLTKEKIQINADLVKALDLVEQLKGQNVIIGDENNHLKESLTKADENEKLVADYSPLGEPKQIKDALDKAENLIQEHKVELKLYNEIGTVDQIKKAFETSKALIEAYKPMGSPEQVDDAFAKTKERLEEYNKLGSPEQIGDAFDKVEKMNEVTMKEKATKIAKELSDELGIPAEKISILSEKGMSASEIRTFFQKLKESIEIQTVYKKKDETTDIDEKKGSLDMLNQSSASRLMSQLSK